MRQRGRRWLAATVVALLAAGAFGNAAAAPATAAVGYGAFGEFTPLTPIRIFSSVDGIGTAPGAKAIANGPGLATFDASVLGLGGVPNDGTVLAVAANITVTAPTVKGFLSAYPKGTGFPNASNSNFRPGQTVPNLAVLLPGTDGKVTVALQGIGAGSAHVLIDVFGYWTTTTGVRGARLISTAPGRIYDSRNAPEIAFGPGTIREITIRGATTSNPATTIPNDPNVSAVVLNVTGINATPYSQQTFLSLSPNRPTGQPTTSNLNLVPNQTKANLVMVPVGADGKIRIYNAVGYTHVAVDVVGYFQSGDVTESRPGRVVPLAAPFRAIDTRDPANGNVRLGPGQAEPWNFGPQSTNGGTIGTTCTPVPCTAGGTPIGAVSALIGNLTGTSLQRLYAWVPEATYLTLFPDEGQLPLASNLNFGEGEDVPNLALAKLSSADQLWVYNARGFSHYLFDVAAMVLE